MMTWTQNELRKKRLPSKLTDLARIIVAPESLKTEKESLRAVHVNVGQVQRTRVQVRDAIFKALFLSFTSSWSALTLALPLLTRLT